MCDVIRSIWIFCPQMPPRDIPKMSQIGVNDSFLSIDDCDGTGDHENYFRDTSSAYEIDGTFYTDCVKKGVTYRSKNEHQPLSTLTQYSILASDGNKYFDVNISKRPTMSNRNIFNPDFSYENNNVRFY